MTQPINRQRLLDRFLQYVRIGTPADPSSDTYPSSPQQLELGKLLAEQLRQIGVTDAHQDEYGLVWGSIPATDAGQAPAIALVAHLDTSPEAPGMNVNPQVITYQGGDIALPCDGQVIRVSDCTELNDLVGKTLITTDGTTLLGGDDKAGVAIIMELAAHLIENPSRVHGPIKVLFTCDEEIGRGTDKVDLQKLGCIAAYTLDGGGAGDLNVETFSADSASVTITGRNIHPSIGKGRMINAVRAASHFVSRLPLDGYSPETTDGRDGFIHPHGFSGGVGQAKFELLLRSFDTAQLDEFAEQLQRIADETQRFFGVSIRIDRHRQYRNMADYLKDWPQVAQLAEQAYVNLNMPVTRSIVRGGTDGSVFSEKGLPTPNLSSGQHAIHSLHEFACLEEMVSATEHLCELLRLWSVTPPAHQGGTN